MANKEKGILEKVTEVTLAAGVLYALFAASMLGLVLAIPDAITKHELSSRRLKSSTA